MKALKAIGRFFEPVLYFFAAWAAYDDEGRQKNDERRR